MNSCADDIKDLLEAESSLGLVFNTNLFTEREPTKPANTVTLFDGASYSPMLTMTKGENYYYDAVQIRIRNTDYSVGYALGVEIMELLHGQGQVTINGTLYTIIYCSSGPALLGWDENGKAIIILNFEIQRR